MSKDRRNSANPHVIRKADPRVEVKVSTAPLPNRAKDRLSTGAAQRCKSASNILHRLKVQQAEEEQRKINESSVSLFTIPSITRKQNSGRDSKLPNITPRPLTVAGRGRKGRLSTYPQSNGSAPTDLSLGTSSSVLPTRGRPPPEPNLNKLSKTLLSSATKRKRAAAILSQRPKTSCITNRVCKDDSHSPTRRSIDYSDLPSKCGTLSTSNLRTSLNSAYKRYQVSNIIDRMHDDVKNSRNSISNSSKTPVRVVSPTIPQIIKTPIRIESRSSSSASDESENSNDSSDEEDSDDENVMQNKRNGFPNSSIIKENLTDNSSESENSDNSKTDDDDEEEDSTRTETDIEVMPNSDSTSSSHRKGKDADEEGLGTDDDTDGDDSNSDDTSSHESDDREDIDVEVFIDESLLNKVNPPGLPTLDVHEQVYLATQLKEEDGKVTGEIKAKKIKTNSKRAKVEFGDELSNDVDSLLETIDETLLLDEEIDTRGNKLKVDKEKYISNHNSISKVKSVLIEDTS